MGTDNSLGFDGYSSPSVSTTLTSATPYNPYANDANNMAATANAAFYQGQAGYSAPFQPVCDTLCVIG
jgi:hypothetical protein